VATITLDFLADISSDIFSTSMSATDKGRADGGSSKAEMPIKKGPARGTLTKLLNPVDVVRFGEITQQEADRAWMMVCKEWLGESSNEANRQALKDIVGQALVTTSSKDDTNLETRFFFNNQWHTLRPLAEAVALVAPGHNDSYIRMFMRSYDNAYFGCLAMDMASDPRNVGLRQDLASRSGGPVADAPYMIDVTDGVIRLSGREFSALELMKCTRYRATRNTQAQIRAEAAGLAAPQPDRATADAKHNENAQSAMGRVADGARRTTFAPAALR
jgi:hypothetical protein